LVEWHQAAASSRGSGTASSSVDPELPKSIPSTASSISAARAPGTGTATRSGRRWAC